MGEPSSSVLDISTTKRQKIERGESSRAKLYSPSQSPLRLDDEKNVRREFRQEGVQGNIITTLAKLEENAPQEPLEPILDLTMANYRGNKINPIIGQAYD